MSMIKLKNVSKFYRNKTTISSGFTKINLELDMGEFVVITGESGSGKSTLLNVISGLDSYEEGEMYINGEETSHYTEVDYENYRRKYIGNIFQHFNLVNSYTVYQNVELVLLLNGYKKKDCKEKVNDIIKTVGLTKYKNTKASKLSGGQKQRVAIARALAKDTPIIVADEPTGNLDVQSAKSIMKLLSEISQSKLVVIVTHNYEQVSEYTTRKISMNDGHIIEDKRLKEHPKFEADVVKYKDLTKLNKIRLGLRNAFNIKTKFILLFLVYFCLTFLVFSEYSSLQKQSNDEALEGYNAFFSETSPNRVVLSKEDKTPFSDEEIARLGNLDNISKVVKDDTLLDSTVGAYDDDVYFYGKVASLNEIDEVDEGEIPTDANSIVIAESKNEFYFEVYKDALIGRELTFQNNYSGTDLGNVKIAGLIYEENESLYDTDATIYVSDEMLSKIKLSSSKIYSDLALTINNRTFIQKDYTLYYDIVACENVKDGEAYVFQELNMYCANYNCLNKKLNLKVSNIYFVDEKDLTIKKVLNKDNFKASTGLQNYENYSNTLFISVNDYNNLLVKGDYQVSVFLDDIKQDSKTLSELEALGYNTYYMKENLVNPAKELMGIFKIIRNIIFIIATVALFFISYFIIKIILKSRNVYFSTIRILGATKKVAKQLLNIELFIDLCLAYVAFLAVVLFAKTGTISSAYLEDMLTYFTVKDYIIVFIVLAIMSILISNRYSHKLFKDSVMSTYREEV